MIFERLGDLIVKRYKMILVIWIVVLMASVPLIMKSDEVVTYQQETESGGGKSESENAQDILDSQFPKAISNSTILVVIEAENISSPGMRDLLLGFEHQVNSNQKITYMEQGEPGAFPKGFVSIYTASGYVLSQAVAGMSLGLYQTEATVNQTVLMLYGIPAMHLQNWLTMTNASANVSVRDAEAYPITAAMVSGMVQGMDPQTAAMATGYLAAFAQSWNASALGPLAADPVARADAMANTAAFAYIAALSLPPEQAGMMQAIAGSFNITTSTNHAAIHAFSVQMVAAGAGMTDTAFLEAIYALGSLEALNTSARAVTVGAFVSNVILPNGTLDTYPVQLPAELRSGFVSPDNTVTIVSIGFTEGDEFVNEKGKRPIMNNVKEIRLILSNLRTGTTEPGLKTYVSGSAALSTDLKKTAMGDLWVIEFVTVPLLIILMGLFFRSILTPILPLGTVMVALGLSQATVYIVGTLVAGVSSEVTTMLFTILMGVGTDYSIFIVARFREERIKGASREDAVRTSVAWAGQSITTSGATVMIAFFSLGIASYTMIKIMGLIMGISILIALLVALTLVPSFLMVIGNRIFWPNNKQRFKRYAERIMERKRAGQHGYFHKAASFSVKNAKAVILVAVLISIPTTYIYFTTETSFDFIGSMPAVESTDGMNVMTEGFGAGRIMPSSAVLVFDGDVIEPDGNFSIERLTAVDAVCTNLAENDIIHQIDGPTRPYGQAFDFTDTANITAQERQKMYEFIGNDNRTVRLSIVLSAKPTSSEAVNAVPDLRVNIRETADSPAAEGIVSVYLGGSSAGLYDVKEEMVIQFNQMEILVIIGIFIVLLIVLGSLFLPTFAILTIGMSITWAYAATYFVFQRWLNVPILFLVPLILFIMLMGIGMDYNIFILTRIREEVAKGKDDESAIIEAVDWTGGIITALAIIMGGAIGALMLSSNKMLAQFGFCLTTAILLDAMVIRTYIVPAGMKLLGKWNWYAPGRLNRARREAKGEAPKQKAATSEEAQGREQAGR